MTRLLLSNGLSVSSCNLSGDTPLHWAAANGRTAAAGVLVEHGADVNAADDLKRTPLLAAARTADSPDLIRLLLHAGADVRRCDDRQENALYKVAQFGAPHSAEVARLLLDAGADVLATATDGQTPLDEAKSAVSCHGNQALVDVLQEATSKQRGKVKD